jgi:hypothetical protein
MSSLLPEVDREEVLEASNLVDGEGLSFLCLPFRYLTEPSAAVETDA